MHGASAAVPSARPGERLNRSATHEAALPRLHDTTRVQRPTGPTDSATPVTLGVGIAHSNDAQEEAYLESTCTPGDPLYEQYLDPVAYQQRFGVPQSSLDAVSGWLRSGGLTVTTGSERDRLRSCQRNRRPGRPATQHQLLELRRQWGLALRGDGRPVGPRHAGDRDHRRPRQHSRPTADPAQHVDLSPGSACDVGAASDWPHHAASPVGYLRSTRLQQR